MGVGPRSLFSPAVDLFPDGGVVGVVDRRGLLWKKRGLICNSVRLFISRDPCMAPGIHCMVMWVPRLLVSRRETQMAPGRASIYTTYHHHHHHHHLFCTTHWQYQTGTEQITPSHNVTITLHSALRGRSAAGSAGETFGCAGRAEISASPQARQGRAVELYCRCFADLQPPSVKRQEFLFVCARLYTTTYRIPPIKYGNNCKQYIVMSEVGEVGATPKLLSSDIKTMGKWTPEKSCDGVSWKPKQLP